MSERFNFYDVYGYLIPGFVLLGLLWLPLALASRGAPSLGFADALGGLLVAYVLGHILSSVSAAAVPSGRRLSPDDTRRPSDDMLDKSRDLNPVSYIALLEEKIEEEFGVKLATGTMEEAERVKLRRKGFLMCRDRLVLAGKGAYAEQFEGMYTMMRGIAGASLLSTYYLLGWLVGGTRLDHSQSPGLSAEVPLIFACAGLVFAGVDFWLTRSWKTLAKWRSVTTTPQTPNAAANPKPPSMPPKPQTSNAPNDPVTGKPVTASFFTRTARRVGRHYPAIVVWFCVGVAFYGGFLLSRDNPSLGTHPSLLVGLAAGAVFLVGRCYAGYLYFATTFAETVYRNFLALPKEAAQALPKEAAQALPKEAAEKG